MKIGYGYIPVRFGIDPRRILLLDFPARDTLCVGMGQREKGDLARHPWLIITRIGPTVADFNSECSISERAASRDTSVSSPVTTGFVLRRGNRRKLESDTEFTRR